MAQRVIRENTVPPGGPAFPLAMPGNMLLPDTHLLKQATQAFQESSEQNTIMLDSVPLSFNSQHSFQLRNIGLGEYLDLFITMSLSVNNPTGGPLNVTLPPDFPYSLISNLQVVFNGKVVLMNASGLELLALMAKRRPEAQFLVHGAASGDRVGAGAAAAGFVPSALRTRINEQIASLHVTATADGDLVVGDTLTGVSAVRVFNARTATIPVTCWIRVPFTLRDDIALGLLPMQNNSVYANVTITTNPQARVFTLASGLVLTASTITAFPSYSFWGIPQRPEMYSFFVNNSYVVTSLPNNPITSTGARALRFNLPNNYWLIASMLSVRDSALALVDVRNVLDNLHMVYNGTVVVDFVRHFTRYAREMYETGRILPHGMLLMDNSQGVNDRTNSANSSKWLNMYTANNPQILADIVGAMALPGSFSVCLEQLVPNYVKIV